VVAGNPNRGTTRPRQAFAGPGVSSLSVTKQRLAAAVLIAFALLVGVAATAGGEQTQQGNLRLAFNARITPKKLPRKVSAPVAMQFSGSIRTADGARPPELRKIAIAFNRLGRVSTIGLPTCESSELEQTTSKGALAACGDALVGHGGFRAFVTFSGLHAVAVNGAALAFNSIVHGKRSILLHVYAATPVQVTFVVPFTVRHLSGHGTFGTVFAARIPKIAANSGYVTNLSLTLDRNYSYNGKRRSFLSARCAVPVGIPGAVFTLARGSFTFSNGQRLSSALARNCWAR
jgi:hypothetical protein